MHVIGEIRYRTMGLVMGVFMGALTDMAPPVTVINGEENKCSPPSAPLPINPCTGADNLHLLRESLAGLNASSKNTGGRTMCGMRS